MDYREIITVDPNRRFGKPCIRDTRISVQDILDYLAGGMGIDEILVDFPTLTREDIQAALSFAADALRGTVSVDLKSAS
jgi:uncharacterized protein (DUF433 family)